MAVPRAPASRRESFLTIRGPARAQLQRERSRFRAFAFPISSRRQIEDHLKGLGEEYTDATHHCFAWRLIEKNSVAERAEDAGEPAGAAGRPILQVIAGRDLVHVLVVVVRYFGGVKLGIGGLIRAYSDATKAVLDAAEVIECVPEVEIQLSYAHALTGDVMKLIHRYRAQIVKVEYQEAAIARVRLPAAQVEPFQNALRDATRGAVERIRLSP
jgi:uncharacterized YigZ family protein